MDLSKYTLEEIILSAIKAEIEARDIYARIADRVKNPFLKPKLIFLSEEEERHRVFFEHFYKQKFPDKEIVIPEKTPVPLPEIKMEEGEKTPISKIFQHAMDAEKAAHDFYSSMAELFESEPEVKNTLLYIAVMEMGHYRLFEIERENALKFEDEDIPMIHLGP